MLLIWIMIIDGLDASGYVWDFKIGCHNPITGHSLVPVAAFSLPASSRQGKYHTGFLYLAMFGIYDKKVDSR